MDRPALDAFACQHRLPPPAIAAALQLTGQRPDATAWRTFAAGLLHAAGLGAIGAGALFLVAANWQQYGVLGRFAVLQGALLVCVVVALWRPPPSLPGRGALILATLLTGGLLALFGQAYQTGADVHELFFGWALLALPFALAGSSGALWAVWWSVLNIALGLVCGWLGADHFVWRAIAGWGVERPALLMLPCVVNLLAAGAWVALRGTRFSAAAPAWLARCLATLGFLYGTAAAIVVIAGGPSHGARSLPGAESALNAGHGAAAVLTFAAISIGIALATRRARRDVFPMALIAASWIAISTTWLGTLMRFDDVGTFFLLALWLIGASTAAGLLLMHWVRAWRAVPADAVEGAAA